MDVFFCHNLLFCRKYYFCPVKDSKLFELLKSLSAYELRSFGSYVQSPYINSNKQVISFHQLISKHHPHYNPASTDKKILFKNLFPQKKYEDKKIRYLFTDYTRLLENFLVDESLSRNESLKEQILRKELASRNCTKAYRTKFQTGIPHHTEDADYFLHQYQAHYTHLDLWISRQKRKEEQNIEAVIENLDKFYFAKKLELSCAVQNFRNVLAMDYKNNFREELVDLIRSHDYRKVPIISVYYQILLTLTKEDDENILIHFLKLFLHMKRIFHCSSSGKFINMQ